MDTMSMKCILLACVLAFGILQVCDARQIILNEDTLLDTCTSTCDDMPTLHNREGCVNITDCQLSSYGWTRGFVRCDYCRCTCNEDTDMRDTQVETTLLSITEDDLFDVCSTTCDRGGLVRTNYQGCQEIRDCSRESYGWTRGFYRCDYCTCSCVNRKYAREYTLTDVHYDLSGSSLEEGAPIALTDTILVNEADIEQTTTRVLSFTTTTTTTVSTTYSLEMGLTVTASGNTGIPGLVQGSLSVAVSLSTGFSYTAGSSFTETKQDQVRAEITVPPRSSITATVVGNTAKIDVPYTAVLVTTYEDDTTSTRRVSGVYTDVETTRFVVQYSAPVDM